VKYIGAPLILCLVLACASAARREAPPAPEDQADAADSTAPDARPARARDLAAPTAADATGGAADAPAELGPPDGAAVEEDAASEGADASADTRAPDRAEAGRPGDACPGYKKGTHTQTGVAVAAFCAAYAKTCPYKTSSTSYADDADCQATYLAATDMARTCLAGHLCEAVASTTSSGRSTNCQAAAHAAVCR
jgi:hypothetical protein